MQTESNELISQIVEAQPFFRFLNPETREKMMGVATVRSVEAGETIVREGDLDDTFYLVESGSASVFVMKLGEPEKVATLGDQDFFGEMALTGDAMRKATVVSDEPMRLIGFTGAAMRHVISTDPNLHEFLASVRMKREEDNRRRIADFEMPDGEIVF